MRNPMMNPATWATAAAAMSALETKADIRLQAISDFRQGSIIVQSSFVGEPLVAGFTQTAFGPVDFHQVRQITCGLGLQSARLDTESDYVGYDTGDSTFDKIVIDSHVIGDTLTGPGGCAGVSNGFDEFSMRFRAILSGVNNPAAFRIKGSIDETRTGTAIADAYVSLRRAGSPLYTANIGAFDRIFPVEFGIEYELDVNSVVQTNGTFPNNAQGSNRTIVELELINLRTYDAFTNPSNRHVYYVGANYPWTRSDQIARSFGGYLTTVNSEQEQDWIVTALQSQFVGQGNIWLGLTDRAVEGQYEWNSGEALAYTRWLPGQPDDSTGEQDYVTLYGVGPPQDLSFWADRPDSGDLFAPTFGVIEVPVGDVNCDGFVTVGDIGPFVLALTDDDAYRTQYSNCHPGRADMNRDLFITVGDIGLFVDRLLAP